jgi:putative hemolysin
MPKLQNLIYSAAFQKLRSELLNAENLNFAGIAERIRDEIDLKIVLSLNHRERIPAEGRLLVAANHPLAFLDLIVLYTVISEIRKDVVIVADNFGEFLPKNDDIIQNEKNTSVTTVRQIHRALMADKAVILFPAKSRHWGFGQISDGEWHKSVVQMAAKWDVPLLPIFIGARNRLSHYFWTALAGLYSDIALDSELVSQHHRSIQVCISHPIQPDAIKGVKAGAAAKLLRKHVYLIGRGKAGTFKTTKNIVHPTDKKLILQDIAAAEILGETEDKIKILLVRYESAPALLREIGRLRELTFRKVGEGTGRKIDLDAFDAWYMHIVLWDAAALEVVGAYRMAAGDEVYRSRSIAGFYTSTLFRFSEEFEKYLPQALELGRSFVQPAYWNSQALDYLWHGIGAFIATHPQYNYLFGPVSVSATYSPEARELLVYFYRKWFGAENAPVRAKHRFQFHKDAETRLETLLTASDYKQAFKELKQNLKHYGFAVPTLYKQYTELCDEGGVNFFDFGIDKDFMDCLDGFIFLKVSTVKEAKLERYVYSKRAKEDWLAAREVSGIRSVVNVQRDNISPIRR